jgi:hypothetical protein
LVLPRRRQVLPQRKRAIKVEKATGSIRGVCILAAVVAILVLAPAAFAQTTADPYAGAGGGTAGQVGAGGTAGGNAGGGGQPSVASEPTDTDDGGVLAFTGLDVALIAGGGLLLLAGGVGLSRVVARNPA